MKLRIKGNTIRLRLTQTEVARFAADGRMEDRTEFGDDHKPFSYCLVREENGGRTRAEFDGKAIRVFLAHDEALRWTGSAQVGIEAVQEVGPNSDLSILVEKDFETHRGLGGRGR